MASATTKKTAIGTLVLLLLLSLGAIIYWAISGSTPRTRFVIQPTAAAKATIPPIATPTELQPFPVPASQPSQAGTKNIAPGWPVALPGSITCTPVLADLFGDGKLSIVVTCALQDAKQHVVNPKPDSTPYVYALRPDGTAVPGWPVEAGAPLRSSTWGGWASSPSVVRVGTTDELVLTGPQGGIEVIHPDRILDEYPGGNHVSNVPVVDLNGDGKLTFIAGKALGTIDGGSVRTWTGPHFRNGYSPAVGDVRGDGQLCIFHLYFTTQGTNFADLVGVDHQGQMLSSNWPQQIDDPSWFGPVLGDVTGEGKMDVIAAYGTHLFAWTADGESLPHTTTAPGLKGILVDNIFAATAPPALADLDGSGKADIIVYDQQMSAIRAWHGDGRGFGNAAGIIANVPGDCHGVSVVSLGDANEMDFFTGTYWVRRQPDGTTQIINMLPNDEQAAIGWTQPTVADVEGNGQADVIFGLSDGRLFVYQTHLAYHANKMQWPTANQNFQHTSAWKPAPASPK